MNELGLFDYLLMIVAMIASWGIYFAAQPPPSERHDEPAVQPLLSASLGGVGWIAPSTGTQEAALPLDRALNRICSACGYRSIETFLAGAKLSYELIVGAFASGDLAPYAYLLSDGVRDAFAEAIAERQARDETIELTFIGLRACDIVGAELAGGRVSIDVRFVGEMVSVTRDSNAKVVAGDPGRVVNVAEIWTFERDLRLATPAWQLTATDTDE